MLAQYLAFYKNVGGVILYPVWIFLKNWWWVFLPFVLQKAFLDRWLWWRTEGWLRMVYRPILLEIKIPKESIKPIRAMEDVMASLHSVIYHPPDWWEKWVDGQFQTSVSFEIASFGGKIHFYIRCHQPYRDAVEASIYSQYPDAEIKIVDDYTKLVPQDIPNQEWDLWGTDYIFVQQDQGKPIDAYPILTYKKFEKEPEAVEEKRVDPVAALFEALSKVKPGQQFWIQMSATPVTPKEYPWVKAGEALRDKLAKREAKPGISTKPMVWEAAEILIRGLPEPEEKRETMAIPPEMRMTPGERDIVAAIEEKISKPGFLTNIRFVYLGKRDVFFKANLRLPYTYFGNYMTQNLNGLIPWGRTLTKISKSKFVPINLLIPRRLYLRQRKIFRHYVGRITPFFPLPGGKFILNTEELASLFHFPSWRAAPVPGVARVEARRRAPPEVPTE